MGFLRGRKKVAELKLTPEGWVFLIVLSFITVGAVLRNVNLLIVMAGIMYATLFLNWRLALRYMQSLVATRRVPNQIHANQINGIQWTCEHRFPGVAAWNVVVEDSVQRAAEADQTLDDSATATDLSNEHFLTRIFSEILSRFRKLQRLDERADTKIGFVQIKSLRSESGKYRLYLGQRGKYVFGPATISTTFPFGLIVSRRFVRRPQIVFVAPQVGILIPTWEQRVQSIAVGSESLKRRRAIEEDEFHALRPWRAGDSRKNIHWRTTARVGSPIVKQHDQRNNRDFALLLDLYLDDDSPTAAEACERVLSFTATAMLQIGDAVQGQIGVAVCGRETEFCHRRSRQGIIATVMRHLAIAQGSSTPELERGLIEIFGSVSAGTPLYVVSSREQPQWLDQLTPQDSLAEPDSAGATDTNEQSGGSIDSASERRLKRQLRTLLPMVRWLHTESEDFESLFSIDHESPTEERLSQLSEKWSEHA